MAPVCYFVAGACAVIAFVEALNDNAWVAVVFSTLCGFSLILGAH